MVSYKLNSLKYVKGNVVCYCKQRTRGPLSNGGMKSPMDVSTHSLLLCSSEREHGGGQGERKGERCEEQMAGRRLCVGETETSMENTRGTDLGREARRRLFGAEVTTRCGSLGLQACSWLLLVALLTL